MRPASGHTTRPHPLRSRGLPKSHQSSLPRIWKALSLFGSLGALKATSGGAIDSVASRPKREVPCGSDGNLATAASGHCPISGCAGWGCGCWPASVCGESSSRPPPAAAVFLPIPEDGCGGLADHGRAAAPRGIRAAVGPAASPHGYDHRTGPGHRAPVQVGPHPMRRRLVIPAGAGLDGGRAAAPATPTMPATIPGSPRVQDYCRVAGGELRFPIARPDRDHSCVNVTVTWIAAARAERLVARLTIQTRAPLPPAQRIEPNSGTVGWQVGSSLSRWWCPGRAPGGWARSPATPGAPPRAAWSSPRRARQSRVVRKISPCENR